MNKVACFFCLLALLLAVTRAWCDWPQLHSVVAVGGDLVQVVYEDFSTKDLWLANIGVEGALCAWLRLDEANRLKDLGRLAAAFHLGAGAMLSLGPVDAPITCWSTRDGPGALIASSRTIKTTGPCFSCNYGGGGFTAPQPVP